MLFLLARLISRNLTHGRARMRSRVRMLDKAKGREYLSILTFRSLLFKVHSLLPVTVNADLL